MEIISITNIYIMVWRRRRFSRRTGARKAKRFYKKYRGIRIKRGRKIHYFKRTFKVSHSITNSNFQTIASNLTGPVYNEFKLTDVPNYTDFTNLYDTYKICAIKRKYIFNKNSSEAGNTGTYEMPTLLTVNDFNDDAALTSENEALEYASCKQTRMDRITKRYFKPTIQVVAGTASSTDYMKTKWTSTEAPDRIHRGIKEAVIGTSTGTPLVVGQLFVYTTYYIACRTPR